MSNNSNQQILVGFDIGGTKTEVVFIQSDGQHHEILSKKRHPTERDHGYEHILKVMRDLLFSEAGLLQIPLEKITSIGFAMPGSVDPQSHEMVMGNTRVLENKPIQKDFLRMLGHKIPISTENDANCFALAEYHMGAGYQQSFKNLVGIILGTGVGGGIIIHGKILQGRRGAAGEIGHIFLKKRGKTCYCHQEDCAELYLSGPGFESYYFEKTQSKKNLKEIFEEKSFLEVYKNDLAKFLGQLTNVLDPDVFVLGGGISLEGNLYSDLQEKMIPHLFYKKDPPLVLKHAISDSAGGIGAALLGKY